jgi:hypothetical protein
MTMDIVAAKKELYNQLKNYSEVTGAGIQEKHGTEYIVIFITGLSEKLRRAIPSTFKGNKVKTEVRHLAKAI